MFCGVDVVVSMYSAVPSLCMSATIALFASVNFCADGLRPTAKTTSARFTRTGSVFYTPHAPISKHTHAIAVACTTNLRIIRNLFCQNILTLPVRQTALSFHRRSYESRIQPELFPKRSATRFIRVARAVVRHRRDIQPGTHTGVQPQRRRPTDQDSASNQTGTDAHDTIKWRAQPFPQSCRIHVFVPSSCGSNMYHSTWSSSSTCSWQVMSTNSTAAPPRPCSLTALPSAEPWPSS